jgi:hypothetical protein
MKQLFSTALFAACCLLRLPTIAQSATDSSVKIVPADFFVISEGCAHSHICCEVGCYCCPEAFKPPRLDTAYTSVNGVQRLTITSTPPTVLHRPASISYVFKDSSGRYSATYHSRMQSGPAAYRAFTPSFFPSSVPEGSDFSDGTALVLKNDAYVLIDESGKELPIKVHSTAPLNSKLNRVSIVAGQSRAYALADKNGTLITPLKYWNIQVQPGGLILAEEFSRYAACFDSTGKEVLPPVYHGIIDGGNGKLLVQKQITEDGVPTDRWGIADASGKLITPLKYDYIAPFADGYARVSINEKWGFIDEAGKEVIKCRYKEADDFFEGLAKVKSGNKSGFIDHSGKAVTGFDYDDAGSFSGGFARVSHVGKWGYIDRSGKVVIPLTYHGAQDFNDGVAFVLDPKKELNGWGMIDSAGKVVVPFQFQYVTDLKNGLYAVSKAVPDPADGNHFYGKPHRMYCGITDRKGNLIAPLESAMVDTRSVFSDGWFLLADKLKDPVFTICDPAGRPVAAIKGYQAASFMTYNRDAIPFLLSYRDKAYGVVDYSGKEILPPIYKMVYSGPEVFTVVDTAMKFAFFDYAGKQLTPFIYDLLEQPVDGLAKATIGEEKFFINTKGERVREIYTLK